MLLLEEELKPTYKQLIILQSGKTKLPELKLHN